MTEKIYYESAYIKEFEGTVLECLEDKKGYRIVLDRSAFTLKAAVSPAIRARLRIREQTERKYR